MKKRFKNIFFATIISILPNTSFAALKIDITEGKFEPIQIAIPDLKGEDKELSKIGKNIAKVISNDLKSSGLFLPVDKKQFINDEDDTNQPPTFNDWDVINIKALIKGSVTEDSGDKIRVNFHLWDISSQQRLEGQSLKTTKDNWRRISHIIADLIYKRMTGEEGYFDTRIVYIAETGSTLNKKRRMAIIDQDGANLKYLTSGRVPVFTPNFSPASQEITYMTFFNNKPQVYLFNLETGQQSIIGNFPGMSFAPVFSPDGNQLVMSIARKGNTDIYEMDLMTRELERLTRNSGIDTSPSFSPDGEEIAFVSDRSGRPQIYTMDRDGSNVKRISFGKGRYGDPMWSPRGDYIAFIKIMNGQFYLGVMYTDGSGERLLTKAFNLESPSWSPNGRRLIYYKQELIGNTDETRVYSIDITGYNERELYTPTEASDPSWSPLLQ